MKYFTKYFWNISRNISEIFKKFHDIFFRLYTHPFNIFYSQTLPFMHTAAP